MNSRFLVVSFCIVTFFVAVLSPVAYAATNQTVNVNLVVIGTSTATTTPTTTPTATNYVSSPSATGSYITIPNISNVVTTYSGSSVIINWRNPAIATIAGVRIVRSPYGIPSDPMAGQVVYQGSGSYMINTSGTPGTIYYYTAFSYNGVGEYSSGTVFGVIWPQLPQKPSPTIKNPVLPPQSFQPAQQPEQPQQTFPIGTNFLPPVATSTTLAPSLATTTETASVPLPTSDILFIQNGSYITPNFSSTTPPTMSVSVNAALPLDVSISDVAVAAYVSSGLSRVLMTVDILGQKNYYLLRDSVADKSFETQLDLSTMAAGGYPFSITFWPNTGAPFAVSGTLVLNHASAATNGSFGFGISLTELWQILILLALLAIFIILIRFTARL